MSLRPAWATERVLGQPQQLHSDNPVLRNLKERQEKRKCLMYSPHPPDEADDDDDPEYNFLEDLDEPDTEDFRTDRAVRITSKSVCSLLSFSHVFVYSVGVLEVYGSFRCRQWIFICLFL